MAIVMHGYNLIEFKDLQKAVQKLQETIKDVYVRKEQYEKEIEELKEEIRSLKYDIKSLKYDIESHRTANLKMR